MIIRYNLNPKEMLKIWIERMVLKLCVWFLSKKLNRR